MRVQALNLSQDIKNIEILPLSDLHVGDISFDRELFFVISDMLRRVQIDTFF